MAFKVDIMVVMGFNRESEEALENALKAAEILRNYYSITALVIPLNSWITDPIKASISQLPKIYINGRKVFEGVVPAPDEIVEYVLKHFFECLISDTIAVPAATLEPPHGLESVATYW